MAFDPNLPQENTPLDAAQMRGQLNGLAALIAAMQSITGAQVDGVITLNPGEAAAVTLTVDGQTLRFTFAIPKGSDGAQGVQGIPGNDGAPGGQGPPFATCIIDSVTTLAPGTEAWVTQNFDGTAIHLAFGIPMGVAGATGADGAPGEVTNAALESAISTAVSGTSNNTNSVATLDTAPSDPPSFADYEALRAKMNEMILAARRA